jgi:hypothetical protein
MSDTHLLLGQSCFGMLGAMPTAAVGMFFEFTCSRKREHGTHQSMIDKALASLTI